MIRVLVVEDDFRVAQVHAAFTERVDGFEVVGTARNAAAALRCMADLRPDLVLLDSYLPDRSGLELLGEIDVDTMMLTAACDVASVRTAFARGVVNYLVKPFTQEQLAARLVAYARYRRHFADMGRGLTQEQIDRGVRLLHDGDQPATPKGQSPVTARLVADTLRSAGGPRSATEVATALGIARATAQRYLAGLAQDGAARMSLRYGTTGRPEHQYEWYG
ncbi:transcriptional regulatory protein [Longimycelium tulufanense]|uniref:Transcriptional regulatory protein n=1 Tax=Longimycelium tulufanense TaxID=907463 RepID=A0A8J3CDL9_9PSEU|nr:response regulator [Longimycelium tulufanense]GGM50556.1 transcriptional regulatory protein [Longimycelium tulufanense]